MKTRTFLSRYSAMLARTVEDAEVGYLDQELDTSAAVSAFVNLQRHLMCAGLSPGQIIAAMAIVQQAICQPFVGSVVVQQIKQGTLPSGAIDDQEEAE